MPLSREVKIPLETLFNPNSIAIVGASANPSKQGNRYIRQLREFGFKGSIYPVNPKHSKILGLTVYSSLDTVPGPIDYVISTVPAEDVPGLIEDCRKKSVKILHLYTGQLGETGIPERKRLEEHIGELACQAGIRLLGPNCMGLYDSRKGLTFRFSSPRAIGNVACISQSAGHAAEVMYRGSLRGLTFSQIISYGNAIDINETELLDHLMKDPNTDIIMAYIEGVKSPDFPSVLRAAARLKPVIIFKVGKTDAGRRAAASHTGSLTGSYNVWKGLMKQCRAISVDSVEELIDTAVAFAKLQPPAGINVGVLGAGGGGSIMAADEFELQGMKLPPLPKEVLDQVKNIIGDDWMLIKNPVDVSVVLPAGWGYEQLELILKLIGEHPLYQILVGDAGEWRPDSASDCSHYQQIVDLLLTVRKTTEKPMAIVLRPADHSEEWRWRAFISQQQRCVDEGAAIFPSVGRLARALGKFIQHNLTDGLQESSLTMK